MNSRRGYNNSYSNNNNYNNDSGSGGYNNNSGSGGYNNDSGSGGYSNVPFYQMSQNSSGGGGNDCDDYSDNQSSNYNSNQQSYNYSRNGSQSSGNYSTGSYGYGGGSQGQNQGSFQYSATMSSDMNSSMPFNYGDNDLGNGNNNRKNRGKQPWVKRDSLKRPAPYTGARGMNLMQKMGWNPGQGLGRNANGELEPSFPDIKMDKRGLDAGKKMNVPFFNKKVQMREIKLLTEGKNPISILEEYCSKRKLEAPKYATVVDEGPVHAKNFIFKVTVDGVDYTAEKGNNVKKTAKAAAAKKCLVELGVLTEDDNKE